ncbi:MAG: hypothetical protein ACMUIG_08160 [Thermoplasmatota archaeon]
MKRSTTVLAVFLMLSSITAITYSLDDPDDILADGVIGDTGGKYLDLKVDPDWMIWGDLGDVDFGSEFATGDLNGDGFDDVAIGIPTADIAWGGGVVLLYFSRDAEEFDTAFGARDADAIIYGEDALDHLGESLLIRDLNIDGKDELIIGAPFADGPNNGRRDCGEVFIVYGSSREKFGSFEMVTNLSLYGHIHGRDPGDHLGMDFACGDLNDDNEMDIIIRNEGYGGSGDMEYSPTTENSIVGSWEIDVIEGDISGIQVVDIRSSGSMIRYYTAQVIITGGGETPFALHIGNGLDTGDFNGDGIDDLAFSYRYDGEGYAVIHFGGSDYPYTDPGLPYTSPGRTYVVPEFFGPGTYVNPNPDLEPNVTIELGPGGLDEAVLRFGEVNADQKSDLLIGSTGASAWDPVRHYAGQVDLFTGRPVVGQLVLDKTDSNWTLFGQDASDHLGRNLLLIDRDGDGYSEIFVGVPDDDGPDNTVPNSGSGYGFFMNWPYPRYSNITDADFMAMGNDENWRSFSDMQQIDMNGDSVPELLIGSAGSVLEGEDIMGSISLITGAPIWDATFIGEWVAGRFGETMAVADFNQDGYKDIVVGAPRAGDGKSGVVHLFFGDSGGWSGKNYAETDSLSYFLADDDSDTGTSVAAGDFNGDSYPDFAMGTPNYFEADYGAVHIYWGGTRSYMEGKPGISFRGSVGAKMGTAICSGDFNGDGLDDLAVSSPAKDGDYPANTRSKSGWVQIHFNPFSTSADVVIRGPEVKAEMGQALEAVDINGDGYDELVIGAPKNSAGSINQQGNTYVLKGSSSWSSDIDLAVDNVLRIDGDWRYDQAGSSLNGSDIDGDGKEDLILGAPGADGYMRMTSNGGVVYLLLGSYLEDHLDGGIVKLKNGANATFFGSAVNERLGKDIASGDIDGDGRTDIIMGAPGWVNEKTGWTTGGMMIYLNKIEPDGMVVNSSVLPTISGKNDQDETGYSVYCTDFNSDGKDDMLIGSPGMDPDQTGDGEGGILFWASKPLFTRAVKVLDAGLMNPSAMMATDLGSINVLNPGEGPYKFTVSGRCNYGYDEVRKIILKFHNHDGSGHAEFTFDATNGHFSETQTGVYAGRMDLTSGSTGENDQVSSWIVDFAVNIGWNSPEPDLIITEIQTTVGNHTNYRSNRFMIDREVAIPVGIIDITDEMGKEWSGWLNATTPITVGNITLIHNVTGTPLINRELERFTLGLFRPDGYRIGTSKINGSRLEMVKITTGENLTGESMKFRLGLLSGPTGSILLEGQDIHLSVDTYPPAQISSFTIFTDGKEGGSGSIDNDRTVEVSWTLMGDIGDSGINEYVIEVAQLDGTVAVYHDAMPGDILTLKEGEAEISIYSIDRANNRGPSVSRDLIIDLEGPIFRDAGPVSGSWINQKGGSVSVFVEDSGSGLDLTSARYRVYRSDLSILTMWQTPGTILTTGEGVQLSASPEIGDGISHYVQWSIDDRSGHTSISDPIVYNVDTVSPSISVAGITHLSMISRDVFNVSATITDLTSGIDQSTIGYRMGGRSDFYDLSFTYLGLTGTSSVAYPSVELLPDFTGWGYLQWMCKDRAGNIGLSQEISVYVDITLPRFTAFFPNNSIQLRDRENSLSAYVMDDESGIGPNDVQISISTISNWVQYGIGGYSPWESVDLVEELDGGLFRISHDVVFDEGAFNLVRYRARDQAGNGWVETTPLRYDVKLPNVNLPPTAEFVMYPVSDYIQSGEMIRLDGSPSIDPEGRVLSYKWYSDLENYPGGPLIGTGRILNITFNTTGVHHIFLTVSDGVNEVDSAVSNLRVIEKTEVVQEEDTDTGNDLSSYLFEIILIIIIALAIGALIGGFIVLYLRGGREREGEEEGRWIPPEHPPIVKEETIPTCPYCEGEVRKTDEYCIHCGSVFTAGDMKWIREGKGRKKKKKKKAKPEVDIPEEPILPPSLEDVEIEDDTFFAEAPDEEFDTESEEELPDDVLETMPEEEEAVLEEMEVFEELDELEDMEIEDDWSEEEWEVD